MLGLNPLASAPLSDDGIVVVSSSISLSGVASQGSIGSLTLTVIDSQVLTSVSSTTAVGSISSFITDTQSLVSVSSTSALGTLSLTVTDSETLSSVSSSSQISSLGVQLEDAQLITSVSSSSQVGAIVTSIIIPLSSTSTTSQVASLQGTSEDLQLLNSVSSSTQIGTVSTSTSEQDVLSGVSSGSSINNISVTVTDLQVLTSAFSSVQVNSVIPRAGIDLTGNSSSVVVNSVSSNGTANETLSTLNSTTQVGSIQIGPSEHLVAVSVTLSVSSLTLSASSNKTVEDVNSALISGNIGVSSSVELSSDSSASEIGVVTKTASSNSTLVKVTSQTFIDISASGTANTDLSTVSSSTQIPNSLDTEVVIIAATVGVNTTSEVNNVSGIETINADVLLDTTPNLYYSGIASNGVTYTSSTQYQSSGVGAEFYFKVASNYSGGTQYFFQADGNKTGWSYQRAYGILQSTGGIGGYVRLGNQLGRNAAASVSVYLPNSGTFSPDTWYKGRIYSGGQRVYAQIFDGSGSLLASNSQLMTISYGSYTASSYQFFLDEFVVGSSGSSNAFTGQITDFSITGASLNPVRSRVLYQRTTPTWAATNSFTNNATAADTLVFDSPFQESHKTSSGAAASPLSFSVDSAIVTSSATLTGQTGTIDSFNVNSSIELDSSTGVTSLENITQTHSSNKSLTSAPLQINVEDVAPICDSTSFPLTTSSQGFVGTFTVNPSAGLPSATSSAVTANLSVSSSVTISSTTSVGLIDNNVSSIGNGNADLVGTSSNSISTSVTQTHSSNKVLLSTNSVFSVNDVSKSASSSKTVSGTGAQFSIEDIALLVKAFVSNTSSSTTVNNLVINLSVTLPTSTSASQISELIVDIDEIIPPALSVSSQVSVGQASVGISVPITSVSALVSTNNLSGSSQEPLQSVVGSLQVGSLTTSHNSVVAINSVSTTSQVAPTLDINSVAVITGVSSATAFSIEQAFTGEASPSGVSSSSVTGLLVINVVKVLPSASSTFNASEQVKGVINTSVQLSTLPLVTVSKGSLTLSTDGFNFEQFKNSYDRARTVYVSRAA